MCGKNDGHPSTIEIYMRTPHLALSGQYSTPYVIICHRLGMKGLFNRGRKEDQKCMAQIVVVGASLGDQVTFKPHLKRHEG